MLARERSVALRVRRPTRRCRAAGAIPAAFDVTMHGLHERQLLRLRVTGIASGGWIAAEHVVGGGRATPEPGLN